MPSHSNPQIWQEYSAALWPVDTESGVFQGLVHPVAKFLARLEMRDVLAIELDCIPGLGVAPDPRRTVMQGEAAKTPNFDPFPGGKRLGHVLEHGVDRQLYVLGRELPLLLDYALDQLRLGHDFSFFIKRLDPFLSVLPCLTAFEQPAKKQIPPRHEGFPGTNEKGRPKSPFFLKYKGFA
jgi:hypothetical protein